MTTALHFPPINVDITYPSWKNSDSWVNTLESIKNLREGLVNEFSTQLFGQSMREGFCYSEKTGELKYNLEKMLYKAVTEKASEQTKEALSRMGVGALDTNPSTFALTCRYSRDFSDLRLPIQAIFNSMSPELGVTRDFYGKDIISSFFFGKNEMNQNSLTKIFSKADKAFMTNKNDSGLVLASMMSSLLNHVSKLKTDSGENMFPDEVIDGYKKEHKDMFVAGDIINKFTTPKTDQVFLLATQPSIRDHDYNFEFEFM
ncbi:hypothetical protein REG_1982 [Candidatus Regiella insecticola LSR1]|uniref:Uncharacterized protein n=1 Tax=Candidatus Regiella insecticola LSR1 TaxID=663321 RepID=E0WV67_9ENTR|nr:hypothetical protein [Candidatus Regiella insecticola]EFL91101.1 hypothetical protein REG_1982 [Candidatus Regiella insecticola LSR1]